MSAVEPLRIVQLSRGPVRAVALVAEPNLRLLRGVDSVYALVGQAIADGVPLSALAGDRATGDQLSYDDVYAGRSDWRLALPIDHPVEPTRCLVSGTGLTHLGSARNRDEMHDTSDAGLTDSMKMFRAGVRDGRPAPGHFGTAPEWFYKGTGDMLRGHGEPLDIPWFAEDGGEEAEVAGVYVIDAAGQPRRIGMAAGNEFSDHVFERTNYLNLASSKLRTCSIGPELVVGAPFDRVAGRVSIEREGQEIWRKDIATGEAEMCHSVANIEHHHFKFDAHRRPGDVHVHFFGAHSLSFADGVRMRDGDVCTIAFEGFGRPLRNVVRTDGHAPAVVRTMSV